MQDSLSGDIAIVTGAARGIGLEIAERLARDGATVVLTDIDAAGLALAAARIGDIAGSVPLAIAGDLSSEAVAREVIDATLDRHGSVQILVNNAGGGVLRPFLEHTPETLKATIDRNLWTALWACWLALPIMRRQGYGRIVNLGADSVRNGLWDHAAYNAAKGGVHALTTGLAREFARDGVTVNTVAPCAVNTPQMMEVAARDPRLVEMSLSVIPMGRAAEMREVASMVRYLASREAGFVTGQVISVNGGSTML